MAIILIRYAEIGLKSAPVRKRFESTMKNNMLDKELTLLTKTVNQKLMLFLLLRLTIRLVVIIMLLFTLA